MNTESDNVADWWVSFISLDVDASVNQWKMAEPGLLWTKLVHLSALSAIHIYMFFAEMTIPW